MATKKELLEKAEGLGLEVDNSMTKAEIEAVLDEQTVEVETHVDTENTGEVQTEKKTVKQSSKVTLLGSGPLSGEYRFAEIPGSIAAKSVEEAIEKAEEIAVKHPALLKK